MIMWRNGIFLLALASVGIPCAAQTNEELRRMIDAMGQEMQGIKQKLGELSSENQTLKTSNASLRVEVQSLRESHQNPELEEQVAALSDRLAGTVATYSQAARVTFLGEFRFRSSFAFGDNAPLLENIFGGRDEHDGYWTDSLLRLGFMYEFAQDVRAYTELQAHWAFGSQSSTSGQLDGRFGAFRLPGEPTTAVRLHQAYVELEKVFNVDELSLRIGRQEILLGRQFQFGNAEWFSGFSFDALRVRYESESFAVNAIVSKLSSGDGDLNQLPSYFFPHDDDELYSIYFTLRAIPNHELDIYWIYVNGHGSSVNGTTVTQPPILIPLPMGGVLAIPNPSLPGSFTTSFAGGASGGAHVVLNPAGSPYLSTAYYHTVGARLGGTFPEVAAGLDWNVEGAYQFGDGNLLGGGERDIDAFTVEAEVGLTLDAEAQFRIYVRFLYADDDYVPLYGNRHVNTGFRARYGLFDVMPMTNVISIQGGFHVDPGPDWTLGATVLWATTEDRLTAPLPVPDDEYGWEVDVWAEYRYSRELVFGIGAAVLFADRALEAFPGLEDTQFFLYFQTRVLF